MILIQLSCICFVPSALSSRTKNCENLKLSIESPESLPAQRARGKRREGRFWGVQYGRKFSKNTCERYRRTFQSKGRSLANFDANNNNNNWFYIVTISKFKCALQDYSIYNETKLTTLK